MTTEIDTYLAPFHLLKHPFYQAWMKGTLPRDVLKDYAQQYFYHVERFPRYLGAIYSNCENRSWRRDLLENLNDEEGTHYGVSHPDLWLQFVEGLGVSEVDEEQARPAIRAVANTFFEYSRKSFHEGLGALYAYESQVPEIAASKIEGLRRHYGFFGEAHGLVGSDDERALQFFEVHRTADVEHRRVLREMIESLPEDQQREAKSAAGAAAESLWAFLTDVYEYGG